jgi:3-hydroxyisobutyrate dehydrogenase-like beta-hydroxyacid dehydrogenase
MKVTVIGLGKMGSVLAKRLLLAKYNLTVFNRTPEKMRPLVEAGARGATSLKEAVSGADIVLSCLLDDKAVLQTVCESGGFLSFLQPRAIHINTATIMPDTSKKLTDLHQQNDSIYLAGNVLGVPKVAELGELTTIVAGNANAIEKCKPLFQAYSSKIINVGTQPFQANVVKICMNYLLATTIEALGELYAFAEKSEVDTNILQILFHSVFAHPAFKLYIDKIKNRNFNEVNFDLKGGYKDIHLFQQAFATVGVVPDIANIIRDKMIVALAHQMEGRDWSAVTEITRLQANLATSVETT